ncbi:extracellular solute-binding protein [Gryllotalpicola reticulitermitis]|uniref:Extracellular solute-binding protein n=1 Tax=Gryllotalpicola reticulitermitis TaxID=1184153 RepID=A0ABV8QAF8_9MICO
MRMRHLTAAGALGLAAAVALTACSGSQSSSSTSSEKGKTLTVWLMQNTVTPASQTAIEKQFATETGATLKIETQQWDNINTKMTTALATNTPPDVVEIGNTDVPLFAATGALTDITKDKSKLSNGGTFLTGLAAPATVNGKLYAAPFYGGARGVIYNTATWAAAGITAPPTTYAEFTADLDKVAAKNTSADFSPIYVTGTYWYGGFSFVADAGGTIATEKGGKWTSGLTSPAAQKGLEEFKEFQNKYSTTASRTAPLDTPDPNAVFGTGKTSAILGNANSLTSILTSYPALKGKVSSFVLPSPNHPGEAAPTYVGGSDLGIAAKSKNQDLALKFVEMIDSKSVQIDQLTKLDGHSPVTQQLINEVTPSIDPDQQAFFKAADKSFSTPAAPGWATIESDQTVLSYFSQAAAGTSSVSQSAQSFSAHLVKALNANQ